MELTPAQHDAVTQRGSNLLVAASAGSGKTEVLARRCESLIADPQNPCGIDRLLVVTFTRAAAAELRVRVAAMLRTAADDARANATRDHLRRQALLVDAADIGTIDAWCGRIVREHFAAAGIDPAFTVLSEENAALFRREVLDELFEWIYTAQDEQAAAGRDWIRRHSRPSDEFLRTLILELNTFREHLVDADPWFAHQLEQHGRDPAEIRVGAERMLADALAAECRFQHDQMEQVLATASESIGAQLQGYRDALAEWAEQLTDAARLCDVLDAIAAYRLNKPRGAADDDSLKEVRERWLKKRLKERWPAAQIRRIVENAPATAKLVVTLLHLEARYRERLDAAKRQRAAYEFADVLRLALDLLGTPTETGPRATTPIARRLQQRYEHILVDEYQDTSPVQVEILRLITRDEPGRANRFMVGDVKQSIYGFRQAEPRLFTELIQAFGQDDADGRTLPLADNFRSHADLLKGLNRLFTTLFDTTLGGTTYGERECLQARRDEIANPTWDAAPRITLHLLETERGRQTPAVDDADQPELELTRIEREACVAADVIRDLLAANAQVPQRHTDGTIELRPLKPADVVVLLRAARQNGAIVARTLRDAGIPAVAAGRESILDSTEVTDVRNVLALLVNRNQDIPLAAYLRGPAVGLSAAELLEVRRTTTGGDFLDAVEHYRHSKPNAALASRIDEALARLDRWQAAERERPLPALLRRILHETGLLFFAQALPGGAHRVATLRALQNNAAEFAAAGHAGVAEFVAHLDALAGQDQAPTATVSGEQDAVRVMTIHAAKGLEFPIVFLLNAGAEFSRRPRSRRSLCDRECDIGLKFADRIARTDLISAAHPIITTRTTQRELEEELRLLYVAATRARERLFIVGHTEPGTWETWQRRYGGHGTPPLIARLNARSLLEWTMLATAATDATDPDEKNRALVEITTHEADTISSPSRPSLTQTVTTAPNEPADEQWLQTAHTWLEAQLDTRAAASPAVLSVSAVKELARFDATADQPQSLDTATPTLSPPSFALPASHTDGRRLGTACHRFLQHADLTRLDSPEAIAAQTERMRAAGVLSATEAKLVPTADLAWFGTTREGVLLAEYAAQCRQEVPFVFAPSAGERDERIIVRGVIDCMLTLPDGLVILDYKTDRITDPARWDERIASYGVQLQLYAAAAAELFERSVIRAALVLLSGRRVVDVPLKPIDLGVLLDRSPPDGDAATMRP